ncbi:MAG: hypothetical protein ACYC7E_00010 [Armatimonadota bacterium]
MGWLFWILLMSGIVLVLWPFVALVATGVAIVLWILGAVLILGALIWAIPYLSAPSRGTTAAGVGEGTDTA